MLELLLTHKGLRTSLNPTDVQGAICHPMTRLRSSSKFNNVEMPHVHMSDSGQPVTAKFVCRTIETPTWQMWVISLLLGDTFIFINFLALY